jgi:hypothetical protein
LRCDARTACEDTRRKTMSHRTFRRYTDLPALIGLLRKGTITLLDPATWDDTNDSYFLAVYKERRKCTTVLALCFAECNETYHHWRTFAGGAAGVCVIFRKAKLLTAIAKQTGVRAEAIRYLTLADIKNEDLQVSDLPFRKRYPFGDEEEFRVIYESCTDRASSLDIPIPLDCIERVILSPWMHMSLEGDVRSILRSIKGCSKLRVHRSTLVSNDEWKYFGEMANPVFDLIE